jgi:hypothetical protein
MEAEDLHVRTEVVAVVDGELSPRLKTQISHDLEAIDGVLVVEKEPDLVSSKSRHRVRAYNSE